jgi:hypothetical protein
MGSKAEYDIDLGHTECENHAASRKNGGGERMPRKLLHGRREGRWRHGRPKKRWLQSLEEDLRIIQVGRWWEKVGLEKNGGAL